MKYSIALFAVLLMFVVRFAHAGEPACSEQTSAEQVTGQLEINTDVPSHLKGAVIIVRRADGKESQVPAERFKVVPRKQQYLTTRTERNKVVSCTTNEPRKNRVALLGGHGTQEGLKSTTNGSTTEVESNVGLVGGAQYQRMITDRLSVGVQGQTNKTGSVLIGVDF